MPQLDLQKYMSTMQQLLQNPQFVTMAERLGTALMQVILHYCVFSKICQQD